MNIRNPIFSGDVQALTRLLHTNPEMANEAIALPDNPATAHPLHRICDGIFA